MALVQPYLRRLEADQSPVAVYLPPPAQATLPGGIGLL
eukprot:CAMPEP_0174292510 /NCGR_PEP_ID=MMETSP0809-20121228/35713_1 /TAXON_ID=73025 ORGANISM="Eutreptiella gymnastica-like, Strain CCMP1594" /NCGR_SAMPLE_ID=MMETSP0809 /ASSEMBLY_ACC=CAM_ASM_000658 /LENGTH=37 /DNA_ID= /DNA_START= /DNA_END= /DNA_ORIENTATION=